MNDLVSPLDSFSLLHADFQIRFEDVIIVVTKDLFHNGRYRGVEETVVDGSLKLLVQQVDDSLSWQVLTEAQIVKHHPVVLLLVQFLQVLNVADQQQLIKVGQCPVRGCSFKLVLTGCLHCCVDLHPPLLATTSWR